MRKSRLITFVFAAVIFMAGFIINDINDITKSDIFSTLKLLGLQYSDAEVDSLQSEIADLRDSYQKIREVSPSNEVNPANLFSPSTLYPPSFKGKDAVFIKENKVEMPRNKEDLAFFSIKELAWLIKNQKITPLELTEIYLSRIKKYNDTLKAVVTITEELALKQAKKATEEIKSGNYKGLLHGIPYGVKDLLAVEGYKTTWGAMPYKDQIINETSTVVKKLEESGAILIAKLTLGALAYGDIWYGGVTKNPWNLKQGSSGSSAGPASATVAGLVAFSIGSETLGSIVSPSTRCGATGLRPTFGGISRHGAMALSWSMDKLGPICRSAEDAAIVFSVIHGKDENDPYSVAYDFAYNPEKSKLKIAYAKNLFSNSWNAKNDSLMLATFKRNGIDIEAVDWFETDVPVGDLSIILTAEAAAAFDELIISGEAKKMVWQNKNAWPNLFRAARTIPAVEYINASRLRTQLISQYVHWIKQYDAVIVPSFGGNQLLVTNLTGHPSVVLPNGFNSNNSPTSFTITGNYYEEGILLELANKFQSLTDFHLLRPSHFNNRN